MSYQHITATPTGGGLGAVIGGVDLRKPQGDAIFAEIRRAFAELWGEINVNRFHNADEATQDAIHPWSPNTLTPVVRPSM